METFDFVRLNADVFHCIHFSPLMVFPGTEVWEWAKQQGLSDTNLTGVTMDTEDFEDGMGYLEQRWPYLNGTEHPRAEMLNYLRLGTMMEDMVGRLVGSQPAFHFARVSRPKCPDHGDHEGKNPQPLPQIPAHRQTLIDHNERVKYSMEQPASPGPSQNQYKTTKIKAIWISDPNGILLAWLAQ